MNNKIAIWEKIIVCVPRLYSTGEACSVEVVGVVNSAEGIESI